MTAIELPPFEPDSGAPLEPPPPPPATENELPPRRRRTKKDAEKQQAQTAEVQTPATTISDEDKQALAGLLTTGFGVGFEIIASRRGDHWRLTKEEATRLGVTWSEPLAPFLARYGASIPWAVALLATSGILLPRLQQDADKLENAENAGRVDATA